MRKIALFLLLVFSFIGKNIYAQSSTADYEEVITSYDLMKIVDSLCSPEFEGRLSGGEGYNRAANYMAEEFNNAGLQPMGDSSYFQFLTVEHNEIKEMWLHLRAGQDKVECVPGKDIVCRGFTGSGKFFSNFVFCGYGISRPDLGFDEYANTDVNGKTVLVFKQNPSWIKADDLGEFLSRNKAQTAFEHGAKAIVFITGGKGGKGKPIGSVMGGDSPYLKDFPMIVVSDEIADRMFKYKGAPVRLLQEKIDSLKSPESKLIETFAYMQVHASYTENKQTTNLVGMIPGTDEKLKHEYIIIGAHLDHVGKMGQVTFPGANDDASGSAAVLEIARAFTENNIKPKRSAIFVLFASEEHGLDGSRHFVSQMTEKDIDIKAYLNLDCIGYGDSIRIGGGESFPELWDIVYQEDLKHTKMMTKNSWKGGGADATPFFEEGIKTLYFVTTNSYEHLHLPTDKPETLNKDLFEKITRLAFLTLRKLSCDDIIP